MILEERAVALAHFFERAGEAPRLIAYDDVVGCPLHNGVAALEWASAVGILKDGDLIHAARLSGETAAAMVERRIEGQRSFVYLGPRIDAPPMSPYEGNMLFDEPGVRAFIFGQRAHALAHFLRATQGAGSVLALLSKRAPELIHMRRWLAAMYSSSIADHSNHMVAGWFATSGAGVLFAPKTPGEPYFYEEIGADTEPVEGLNGE